jgi:hypothetical protein
MFWSKKKQKKPTVKIQKIDGKRAIVYDFGSMNSKAINQWFVEWYAIVLKDNRVRSLEKRNFIFEPRWNEMKFPNRF